MKSSGNMDRIHLEVSGTGKSGGQKKFHMDPEDILAFGAVIVAIILILGVVVLQSVDPIVGITGAVGLVGVAGIAEVVKSRRGK